MSPLPDYSTSCRLVVKLGGSLIRGAPPRALLARLSPLAGLVLVPGGGAFADAVREAQPRLGFSAGAAHRMAILAMEQTATLLQDLAPALRGARTLAGLSAAGPGAALWFPASLLIGAADISESWDITSDSLALWLACRLGAPRLLLVKAEGVKVPPPAGARASDLAAWSRLALVDRAFEGMALGYEGDIVLAAADDASTLDTVLAPYEAAGRTHEP
ncbi:amino acid kinase family protein [Xanthobacter sediminis]